jgi:cytidylate kinase
MPVVTVGRQIGAGGKTVGEMLARRLKVDVLNSQLIDEVAHRLQLPKEEVEAEDEQPGSLLHRLLMALGSASGEPMIPPETTAWNPPNVAPVFDTRRAVLQITQHVIQEAARAGNVVIVGRGGAYILNDFPDVLHVFLRAAEAIRLKVVMARFNLTEDEARRRLKHADENWTAYIKQVYGHDRNLASHYDRKPLT